MFKRLFDIFFSLFFLVVLSPLFLLITIWIILDSRGGAYYVQKRVGRHGRDFNLYKFRTMGKGSEKHGLLTRGDRDKRITRAGRFLRKYKLDELPQLWNILAGSMSVVGPRPEVRHYVDMYDDEQRKVLTVRPGLTDLASLEYINEGYLLGKSDDPEKLYVEKIMPEKLRLNLQYIENMSMLTDLQIIYKTIKGIFK